MKVMSKKNRGVTLVVLVVTIIIMLILAGIVLSLTIGEHGIIHLAQQAGRNYQNAADYEQTLLEGFMNEADNLINGNETQHETQTVDFMELFESLEPVNASNTLISTGTTATTQQIRTK